MWTDSADPLKLGQDIEEIVRETLDAVARSYRQQEFTADFTPWATGILKEKIADFLRKRDHSGVAHQQRASADDEAVTGTSEAQAANDLRTGIDNALLSMTVRCQTMLLDLFHQQGSGGALNVADYLLFHCRKRLKAMLKEGGVI